MRKGLLVTACLVLGIALHGFMIFASITIWSVLRVVDNAHLLEGLESGAQSTIVFDRRQQQVFSFYTEQRIDVPLDKVSPHFINALLAAEDRRYFSHHGLDPVRMVASAVANLRAHRIVEGGSTITQQLVRATLLERNRTYSRKIREVLIAAAADARFTKKAVLEAYLNRIYFGDGYHGIEAAARGYFGKPAAALDPAEAALLAGIIKAPSALTPRRSPEQARLRRNLVLRAMVNAGWLAQNQYRAALVEPIRTVARQDQNGHEHEAVEGVKLCGLFFKERVRRELVEMFGEERVYRDGLRVYSTLDPVMQLAAEQSIQQRITALAKPSKASKKSAPPEPELQGSLVAIDATNGDVLALVGGRDFHVSPYDRATAARRPPGSAFKPLVFAAALERGYAPGTVLDDLDAPIASGTEMWLPNGEHEAGQYTLRRALTVSSNRAAAQLMQRVGVGSALEMSRRLGIQSRLPAVPSLALGTGEVTLLELTSAYSAFANRGTLASPRFIRRVEDRYGRLLWEQPAAPTRRVLSEATAFMMSAMLADVVNRGTAATARQAGFKLPAAGKTGTSEEYADAWFIGYTPKIVSGVWFGYDRPSTIMRRGFASVVAVPAWAEFMKRATAGSEPEWFKMPPSVERVAICRLSGERAAVGCRHAATEEQVVWEESFAGTLHPRVIPGAGVFEEYFALGTAPWGECLEHGPNGEFLSAAAEPPMPERYGIQPRPVGTTGTIVPAGTALPPPQ